MHKIFDISEFQFFIFVCSKLLLLQFLAEEISKKFPTTLSSSTGRKGVPKISVKLLKEVTDLVRVLLGDVEGGDIF